MGFSDIAIWKGNKDLNVSAGQFRSVWNDNRDCVGVFSGREERVGHGGRAERARDGGKSGNV